MVLDFKVNRRLVVVMTINFFYYGIGSFLKEPIFMSVGMLIA